MTMRLQSSHSLLLFTFVFISCASALPYISLEETSRALLDLARRPSVPRYSSSFEVSYNFTLPYEIQYLPDGLTLPVRYWRDAVSQRARMDTYNGVNSLISSERINLEISPQVDKLKCAKFKNDPGEPGLLDILVLPDVSGWKHKGSVEVRDQHCHLWEYSKRHGDKHTVYKFYSNRDGDPVRLHMHGNDAFSGAHFDIYVADYYDYKPGPQDSSIFDAPKVCDGVAPQAPASLRSFPLRMKALVPSVRYSGVTAYDLFLETFSRFHSSRKEYEQRADAFRENAQLIERHNQDASKSFKLELNRFSDWTQAEFEAVMLPRHKERRGLLSREPAGAELPYKRLVAKGRLPGAVDWRGTPADQFVKDQAACGSCWAFSASGALEAAHYLATGEKKLFSEQQMMDCSWGYGLNKACDGGDYDAAMDYLKKAGGLADERQYQYLGADGFCASGNLSAAAFTPFEGYAYVPPGDDEALMEAVYSRGPIAVSLDASQPSFRFYSGGVMDEANCMWKSEDLDHAVLLVGYGTCQASGKPYWLIRNSWSTYWGDKGYVKIARAHHGCGITTDPVYAVFNKTAVTPGSAVAKS